MKALMWLLLILRCCAVVWLLGFAHAQLVTKLLPTGEQKQTIHRIGVMTAQDKAAAYNAALHPQKFVPQK